MIQYRSFIGIIVGKLLGVAQLGSALEWGSRGRRFKSSHPDHAAFGRFKRVVF